MSLEAETVCDHADMQHIDGISEEGFEDLEGLRVPREKIDKFGNTAGELPEDLMVVLPMPAYDKLSYNMSEE